MNMFDVASIEETKQIFGDDVKLILYDEFVEETADENGEVDNNYYPIWLKDKAERLLGEMSYDEMTPEQERLVVEYETEIWKQTIKKLMPTMSKDALKEQIHDWWLDYEFADGTEDNLINYVDIYYEQ